MVQVTCDEKDSPSNQPSLISNCAHVGSTAVENPAKTTLLEIHQLISLAPRSKHMTMWPPLSLKGAGGTAKTWRPYSVTKIGGDQRPVGQVGRHHPQIASRIASKLRPVFRVNFPKIHWDSTRRPGIRTS
jgi:hypothetical protein